MQMKQTCKCELREYMTDCLTRARIENSMSQSEFSEHLMMDTRSYAALEHGDSLCCTLTFILYLVLFCKNVDELVKDLREIVMLHISEEKSTA